MRSEVVTLTKEELQQAILQAARMKLIGEGKAKLSDTLAGEINILGVWSILGNQPHVVEVLVTYVNAEGNA